MLRRGWGMRRRRRGDEGDGGGGNGRGGVDGETVAWVGDAGATALGGCVGGEGDGRGDAWRGSVDEEDADDGSRRRRGWGIRGTVSAAAEGVGGDWMWGRGKKLGLRGASSEFYRFVSPAAASRAFRPEIFIPADVHTGSAYALLYFSGQMN